MKTTVTYEFEGCFEGCPHSSEFNDCHCLPMRVACWHPSFDNCKTGYPVIMGACVSSNILKEGEKYPEWCPVAKGEKDVR